MTSLKDQKKLLKDVGKGVEAGVFKSISDGIKKFTEPFVKEAVGLPEAKKLLQGIKTTDGKRQKKLAFGIKAANRDKAKVKK